MILGNSIKNDSFLNPVTPSVKLLAERMNFENLTVNLSLEDRPIIMYSISRPALQLTGFFDFFESRRVQIIGKAEQEYLSTLPEKVVNERFERIAQYHVPCIIFTRNYKVKKSIINICERYDVPVFRTPQKTSDIDSEIIKWLKVVLAPKISVHGVLVDVCGVGVLIRGDSGIGKSEAALELIKRGHRLVSDDVVEIRKVSDETLVGFAPEITRDFIELRGIGIVNVRSMFGYEAVKATQNVDMVVDLEEYKEDKEFDRLGLDRQYTDILGNQVMQYTIPIRPGRNIAIIVECAAINFRAGRRGFNAPEEFLSRVRGASEQDTESNLIGSLGAKRKAAGKGRRTGAPYSGGFGECL